MKRILLISFDIIRQGECDKSYSIASLLAFIKGKSKNDFEIDHWSFNSLNAKFEQLVFDKIASTNLNNYEMIALSNYVWSEYIIRRIILQVNKKFKGLIILGGNQITYSTNLPKDYPGCQIFVTGFGEFALLKALSVNTTSKFPKTFRERPILKELPSPYLSKELNICQNQKMVRMETKRGCIFSCNFCAHRELHNNSATKVVDFPLSRIYAELDLFKKYNVKKINIMDPIFNYGKQYNTILKYISDIDLKAKISLQSKFELIQGKLGGLFLELCKTINVVLEFGLQTIYEDECKIIGRSNKLEHISEIISDLNREDIDYEVHIIYGLPNQTLKSFNATIKYLKDKSCKKIIANPLMLLKGTELYYIKDSFKLQEEILEGTKFPVVTQSNSFSKSEWLQMHKIAKNLK
jgi:radical SAM superfamily enzyme YgiQ (UPF0313 family)